MSGFNLPANINIRFNHHGQVTPRLFHPRCCQRARWARGQHWEWKLWASQWPTHDGAGKPGLWFAKWGRKRASIELPWVVRNHHHQGCRTWKRQAPLVSLLPLREGKAMVLPEQGSYQHVGQMFRGVPQEIFSHEQNKCSEGKDIKLPAYLTRIHSWGLGKALGVHLSLPPPRDGRLARALEFLQGADTHV